MKKTLLIIIIIFCSNVILFAQERKKIEIVNSNTLEVNEFHGPDIKILKGDVQFYHDSATMYCDSAHYNTAENFFKAFNNIHVIKPYDGDTVHLYGDSLVYNGYEKLAQIRYNVKLTKDSVVLLTENLDFDLIDDVGYYFDNGVTYSNEDTLKSVLGYYYSRTDELYFKEDVIVKNPKYTMYSDTLLHNLDTKITYFLGPTEIVGDSNYIYCENGWYNHDTDIAQFNQNAYLTSKEHKLVGDSLYYDRQNGMGKAFMNVEIIDTVQNAFLTGNKAIYYEATEFSILTDSALFKQINEADTIYLHADTLMSQIDSMYSTDTTTAYRIIRAYKKVKLYKSDVQAKCDSLVYTLNDSIIRMFTEPVIWSDSNQLSADSIKMFVKNDDIERVELNKNCFIIEKTDSLRYNQIFGDQMIGYIQEKKIQKIDVNKNSKVIYFARDDGKLVAINKAECENMKIIFKDGQVDRIWFYNKPIGTMYPPFDLSEKELYLEGFAWWENYRPIKWTDVFNWESDINNEKTVKNEKNTKKKEDSKKNKNERNPKNRKDIKKPNKR